MELSIEDPGSGSVRVWIDDGLAFSPQTADVQVTGDLSGGVSGAQLWPYTVRFKDLEGGVMRIAQPGILVDPWNAVAGSNWIYDQMLARATQDYGAVSIPSPV